MRFLIITYYKKATGQMDEVVSIAKNLKPRDHQSASVILDFKTQRVEKCSLDGVVVPRDWDRIRDFYYQHYNKIIDELETINGKTQTQQPQNDPS